MERDPGEGWDKERRKVKKENNFLEEVKRTQIGTQILSFYLSSLFEFFERTKKICVYLKNRGKKVK